MLLNPPIPIGEVRAVIEGLASFALNWWKGGEEEKAQSE